MHPPLHVGCKVTSFQRRQYKKGGSNFSVKKPDTLCEVIRVNDNPVIPVGRKCPLQVMRMLSQLVHGCDKCTTLGCYRGK